MRSRQLILGVVVVVILIGVGVAGILLSKRPPEAPPGTNLEAIQADIDAGAYSSAREKLLAVVAADESDAEAHFKLGLVHFNLGEYEDARTYFSQAMALDPARASAVHHNLGVLAYQQGDMDTALVEFQAALETDPEDADTHYQLGATYLLQAFPTGALEPDPDLLKKAEAEFVRALELVPDKPEALVGLANVAMLQNDIEGAIEMLEQAVELQPSMREALFALGRAYAVVGRTEEAQTTLRTFLDTDPPEIWAQQAEQLLGELSGE